MNVRFPEYGNCIANLACSVMRSYGVHSPNATLPQADALLKKEYKNVILILLDGMGTIAMEKLLSAEGFFRRNLQCSYSSTFPPTTVAATTAIMSGLYPNQSAWLGWSGYFDEIDRNVVYFTNKDNDTGEKLEGFRAAETYVPYTNIRESIEAAGIHTHWLTSWNSPACKTYAGMCGEIRRLCEGNGRQFVYAYWEEPDNTMHKKGVYTAETHTLLKELEAETEQLSAALQDTLLLVTADHGLLDSRTVLLSEDEEIIACLVRNPSIESRAMNLFVKEDCKERFEQLFRAKYGDHYQLLPMTEVRNRQLFGCGLDHVRLHRMLGDYLAIATDEVTLRMKDKKFIGEHGGMTAEEMLIPLIAVET